jgi:hypothetical protein
MSGRHEVCERIAPRPETVFRAWPVPGKIDFVPVPGAGLAFSTTQGDGLMQKLPKGIVAAAVALLLSACGGMMDRGGWGSDTASRPASGSAVGSSSPDPAGPNYGPGGTIWQPPD